MAIGIMPGEEIAGASATLVCTDAKLREFMQRVEIANRRDDFLARVTEVVVYGSSIRDLPILWDTHIACRLESKVPPAERPRAYREHFRKSGRPYSGIGCEYLWASEEVMQFLQDPKHTINLHSMSEFLDARQDDRFCYQVLLGDPAKVARRLKDYEYLRTLD